MSAGKRVRKPWTHTLIYKNVTYTIDSIVELVDALAAVTRERDEAREYGEIAHGDPAPPHPPWIKKENSDE